MAVQISGNDITVPRDGSFTRNVTIGGTLTYEDVTNIDSVGLVTARSGIEIGARPGVAASISVDGNMIVSGITTIGGDIKVGSGVTIGKDGDIFATGITTMNQIKITTGANAFETSANVFKGASGQKGVYLRSALSAEDTPSYSSVDDTNTGIFLPGSDVFGVTTGGSERLRITSDGKIAIGEDDPDGNYLLIRAASTFQTTKGHIMLTGDSATVGEGPQIVFSESGSGSSNAGAYVGHVRTGSNSIGDLVFGTRATSGDANTVPTERLRITSGGLVGVGQATPTHMLHVDSSSASDSTATAFFKGRIVRVDGAAASNSPRVNFSLDGTDKISIMCNRTDSSLNIETLTAAPIIFDTSNTERLRIQDNNGDILFGNYLGGGTNQPRVFFLSEDGNFPDQSNRLGLRISNGYSDASIRAYGNNSGWTHVKFYSTHLSGGTVTTAGSITMSGGNTIAYNTSSDYRLKENEVLISDGITRLKQLKPYRFNWKTDTSKKVDGFYAHEVSGIVPEAITGEKDGVVTQTMIDAGEIDEAIGTPVYQQIDQAKLVPVLTAALQEAIAKIEVLESRLDAAGL